MSNREHWEVSYQPDRDLGRIHYTGPRETGSQGVDVELQFQNGPIQENGINGIQNEEVLDLMLVRLRALNARFPCRENSLAITKIEEARMWLGERYRVRVEQGVEGKNLAHVS